MLRRYSDFLWLYETLSLSNPGVVVPPVPEKNPFGRFDQAFVKQRRLGLEKCVQKMTAHPVLCKDPDLKLFLESDTFSLDVRAQWTPNFLCTELWLDQTSKSRNGQRARRADGVYRSSSCGSQVLRD